MVEEDSKLQLEESMDIDTAEGSGSEDSSAPVEKVNKDASVVSENQANNAAKNVDSSGDEQGDVKENIESPKKSKKESAVKELKLDSEESDVDEDADTSNENINESAQLIASGKRDRKKVERLSFSAAKVTKAKIEAMGDGLPLGDVPYIEHMISSSKSDDLKFLHTLLYRRSGNKLEIKRNLRCFNGFSFSKEDEEFQSLINRILKWPMKATVVKALSLFGQPVTGSKQELAEKLAEFLLCPVAVEKSVPGKRGKKSAPKKKSSTRKSIGKTKKKSLGKKPSKDSDSLNDDDAPESKPKGRRKSAPKKVESDSSEDDEDNSSSEVSDNGNSEEEEEAPVKTPKAKAAAAKTVKNVKSTPALKRKKEEDSDDESDNEPLVKKVKKSAPSDDDIKDFLKDYMKSVDLEEVTMKSIYQKVYDQYPEADLTSRKEFIKETVKKMLA